MNEQNFPQVPSNPVITETPQIKEKSNVGLIVAMLVVGIVIGAILLLALLLTNEELFKKYGIISSAVPVTQNQNTINNDNVVNDPKTDTKTDTDQVVESKTKNYSYNNKNIKFSLDYPKGFTYGKEQLGWNGPSLESILTFDLEFKPTSGYNFTTMIVNVNKTDKSLSNYAKSIYDNQGPAIKSVAVGSMSAVEYIGYYKNAPAHYISVLNNGYVYSVGVSGISSSTAFNSNNSVFLKEIISTVLFK